MKELFLKYKKSLVNTFDEKLLEDINNLANAIYNVWVNEKSFFICGNGGSAGNANHIANDFLYGVASNSSMPGIKVESLASNPSVITCLANDLGYEQIYSEQLKVKGKQDDLLLVLSGSGNSLNVVNAIIQANKLNMNTFSIVGFDGGKCKELSKYSIHTEINDMQISEDLQLIILHVCMQWLYESNEK